MLFIKILSKADVIYSGSFRLNKRTHVERAEDAIRSTLGDKGSQCIIYPHNYVCLGTSCAY